MFYIGKNENKVFINHCEFFHGVIRYYVLP